MCPTILSEDNCSPSNLRNKNYLCRPCATKQAREWRAKNIEHNREYQNQYQRNNLEKIIWNAAKQRARKQGIPFNIEVSDVIVPDTCPVLGFHLERTPKAAGPNSPSLDRIKPELGYVKGNVEVISQRANLLKSNADIDDLKRLIEWMEQRVATLDELRKVASWLGSK